MSTYLSPLVVDVSARFEAQSEYFISPGIQRKFDELSTKYKEFVWFGGHYGGSARIFTDSHGIGTSSRIEVGRAVFNSSSLEAKMEDVFRLFREAEEEGLTSGGITSIRIIFNKKKKVEECLPFIKRAFDSVLGDMFPEFASFKPAAGQQPSGLHLADSSTPIREKDSTAGNSARHSWQCIFHKAHSYYELGMALVHQPLVDHLFNTGPYNTRNKSLLDDIHKELESEEGSYENISVFVLVDKNPCSKRDTINLVYTSDGRKEHLERKMEEKCNVSLRFLEDVNNIGESEEIVTLQTYGSAIRTYGSLWMLKSNIAESTSSRQDELPGIVLTLARKYVPLLYLFFDNSDIANPKDSDKLGITNDANAKESDRQIKIPLKTLTWDQLYERLSNSTRVSKSHSESPTYLDSGLRRLENLELIDREKDEYKLVDDFAMWQHVTYYSLGDYRRAMSELKVDTVS